VGCIPGKDSSPDLISVSTTARGPDERQAVPQRPQPGGAVVLTPVRPSAKDWLAERDRLLAEPGVREELDAFFDNLRDPSPPPERDWP
jgi:hypothetical protein